MNRKNFETIIMWILVFASIYYGFLKEYAHAAYGLSFACFIRIGFLDD